MRALLLLLFGLAACAPGSVAAPPADTASMTVYAAAYCDAKGGRLTRIGKDQHLACFTPYADAGKACTDGAQCLGNRCLAESSGNASAATSGTCAPDNNTFGCQTRVEAGVARAICID